MNKDIKDFVDILKREGAEGWNELRLSEVEAPVNFCDMALKKALGKEQPLDGLKGELLDEEIFNEFKDEVYDDIACAITELGGKVVYSSPDRNELVEMCLKEGMSEEDIDKLGEIERFDLIYKF